MKRFWIKFEGKVHADLPSGLIVGCGVTAYSYEDALEIISQKAFDNGKLPKIDLVVENVDISTLDRGHVIPNMGNIFKRGIWFPLGYQ